jgi:hypothetical protein
MKIYQYQNYEEYVQSQTEANVEKINLIHVAEDTIRKIVELHNNSVEYVLCHGTRNGAEQRFFKKFYPDSQVIGTEISHTATQFDMTAQWDFHKVKDEWCNHFDIVYSNSFDHSIDPVTALSVWRDQLNNQGKIYLEHSFHVKSRSWDPLEIEVDELLKLFKQVGLSVEVELPTRSKTGLASHIFKLGKQL